MPRNTEVEQTLKDSIEILIIGDCEVGKTTLYSTYGVERQNTVEQSNICTKSHDLNNNQILKNTYCKVSELNSLKLNSSGNIGSYEPTIFSVVKYYISINSLYYEVKIVDPSGSRCDKELITLREFGYNEKPNIDVILMCFSLVDRISLSMITKKWYPEVIKHYPNVPILLVGTKADIKDHVKSRLSNQKQTNMQKNMSTTSNKTVSEFITANSTFSSRESSPVKKSLKQKIFNSPDINHNRKILAGQFLIAGSALPFNEGELIKNDHKSCSYCTLLDEKNQQSDHSSRAISVVSKINVLLNLEKANEPVEILKLDKKEKNSRGFGSLKSIPKFFNKKLGTSFLNRSNSSSVNDVCASKKLNRPSVCTLATPEKSFDDDELDDKNAYTDNDYENLDITHLDSLIANLEISKNYYKKTETAEATNSCLTNIGKICNPVSLCVECQRNVDLKDEKNFASVAGRVVLETSTAVSVLEESRSSDHNRTGDSRALNEALNETVETAPELPKALPPKRTVMNLEEICKQQLVKKGECLEAMKAINAKKYMKCSSLNIDSVKDVMDAAIELALQSHEKKQKIVSKKVGFRSLAKMSKPTAKDDIFNNSIDTVILPNAESLHNIFLNESLTKALESGSGFSRKNFSKKFSNSTELGDEDNLANVDESVGKLTLETLEKLDSMCKGIELPIRIVEAKQPMSGDEERSIKKKREKRSGLSKKRSFSRCLSCTRVNNDTSSSLNKI